MNGHGDTQEREHQLLKRMIAAWDISKFPSTNDRLAKLGYGMGQRYAAIGHTDLEAFQAIICDGLVGDGGGHELDKPEGGEPPAELSDIKSQFLQEPDSKVLRLHSERGEGKDNVWADRLISDATNPQSSRLCRGTLVIDQESDQQHAWFNDLFRIVELPGSLDDPELWFNGAGKLDMLYPPSKRGARVNFARNAGSLATFKNLGFYNDSTSFAPWWHILAFEGAGGGGSQAAGAAGTGRPKAAKAGGIRADVHFMSTQGNFMLTPIDEKVDETEGMKCKGFIIIDSAPPPRKPLDLFPDPNCNFPEIPRGNASSTRVFVKVPPPYLPVEKKPCNPDTPTPPTEPSPDVPTPPVAGTASPFTGVPTGMPGVPVAFTLEIPVPRNIPNMTSLDIDMPMAISAAYGKGQSTELQISTQTAKNCDAGGLSAPSWEGKSITSADALHTNNYRVLRKSIPASQLADKDKVVVTIHQMSTTTGPVPTMVNPTAQPGCALPIPPSLPRFV